MRVDHMSELVRLIDEWRDAHGQPSEASVSRAISPTKADNLVRAWRARGLTKFPDPTVLEKLARHLNVPMETVVLAAARDVGILRPRGDEGDDQQAPAIGT
jgi:hypothetical protein